MTKPESNNEKVVVEIHDLYKSFEDNEVLRGIDMKLYKGENVVILGRSGSGKSVLIKIISGLMPADRGTVKVFGKEIDKHSKEELIELRLRIGFLFQHSALYDSMTVRQNLEFPLKRHDRKISKEKINEAVEEVLDAVGLTETVEQLPDELSGGQQK